MSTMAETKRKRTRRSFTDEFKAGAIRLVLDEGKTVAAAARDLDLAESSLRDWVERADAGRGKLRERAAVRFQFIAAESAHHSLSMLCRCLRVTQGAGFMRGGAGRNRRACSGIAD
jgi:transposase-like protein